MKHYFINLFMREPSVAESIAALGLDVKTMIGNAGTAKEIAEKAAKEAKEAAEGLKLMQDSQTALKGGIDAMQKAQDALQTELKLFRQGGLHIQPASKGFEQQFAEKIGAAHKDLKAVSKGNKWTGMLDGDANIMRKAAGVMTTATDLSGSPVVNFLPTPALLPPQKVNFRDLVSTFQSSELTINLFRESNPTPAQGGFAQQLTEGTTKGQIEYNYANVPFTAYYIAGFVRFAKQMVHNLPWLQTYLPQQLMRDFYIKENAVFAAAMIAAATGNTATTDGGYAGRLIQAIANLEGTNFTANGIVVTPATWAILMLTTVPTVGTSYSLPGGVQIMPNGQMMIAGIPIIKANWQTANYATVADWTEMSIAQVENLKIEFFEQDSDNVERNLITCRVEALECLVINRPEGIVQKLLTGNA